MEKSAANANGQSRVTDLATKLASLGATVSAKQAKAATDRAAAWNRIQAEAPDLAEFLTEINANFGRPRSITVRIDGEKVL